jgi:ABC-type multidrug transport system ATPase subunit
MKPLISMSAASISSSRSSATTPAVRAIGIKKTLDERPVLRGVDLTIAAGEFVGILGINGAGKTTLLKLLSTLAPPSAGQLELFGIDIARHSMRARARLGLIGHQSMLYRDLTARENLQLFARLYGVKSPKRRAEELLDIVGLFDRADDPVKTFSRGMSQRVSIARALVHEPDLVLADEPFAGLDVPGANAIERLLTDLHRRGKTIVMVNHDVPQTLLLAQRIIVLQKGIVGIDQPARVADVRSILAALAGGKDSDRPGESDAYADAVNAAEAPCR